MKKSNLLALFLLIFTFQLQAQVKMEDKAKESYILGKEYLKIDELDNALKSFLKADKAQPNHPEICFFLGKTYIRIKRLDLAIDYLKVAAEANYDDKTLFYEYGHALHANNRFDEAKEAFTKYKNTLKEKEKDKSIEIDRLIENCDNGKELVKNPVSVDIKNLGKVINSRTEDYMPLVTADESMIVFTSRRTGSTGGELDDHDSKPYEDIYFAERVNDTTWGKPKNIGPNVNTAAHDAAVGITPDGQEIFIHIVDKKGMGDLFVSKREGKIWTQPVSLGNVINLPTSNENSCSLTSDEKYIFFSSDRPGGQGGLDIWVSKKNEKGEWSEPINLGPKINTPYDEESPFIHADGISLYFSSKGHNSMGGFDIFEIDVNPETGEAIGEVKNVGYPINSYANETFISWTADGLKAYVSSVKDGGVGEEDIYEFTRSKSVEATHVVIFKGFVKDAKTKNKIAANITIINEQTNKVVASTTTNSSSGEFLFVLKPGTDYGIEIDAPKHMFTSRNINIPDGKKYQLIVDSIFVETPRAGHKANLNNIFFEEGNASILPSSKFELDKLILLLNNHKMIKMQIGAHVFTEKDAEKNMKLSEERARAVVEYLKTNGILATRLSAKPFGNTTPLKSNKDQNNNRIEIEVK